MQNSQQQAFPVAIPGDEKAGWNPEHIPGLTKREYFAAMALQGMLSNPKYYGPSEVDLTINAVAFADALLFELEKPQQ